MALNLKCYMLYSDSSLALCDIVVLYSHLVAPENNGGLHFKHKSSLSSLLILPSPSYATLWIIIFFFPSSSIPSHALFHAITAAGLVTLCYICMYISCPWSRGRKTEKMKMNKIDKNKKKKYAGMFLSVGLRQARWCMCVGGWIGGGRKAKIWCCVGLRGQRVRMKNDGGVSVFWNDGIVRNKVWAFIPKQKKKQKQKYPTCFPESLCLWTGRKIWWERDEKKRGWGWCGAWEAVVPMSAQRRGEMRTLASERARSARPDSGRLPWRCTSGELRAGGRWDGTNQTLNSAFRWRRQTGGSYRVSTQLWRSQRKVRRNAIYGLSAV